MRARTPSATGRASASPRRAEAVPAGPGGADFSSRDQFWPARGRKRPRGNRREPRENAVEDSKQLLRGLILGVAHLCTRTRALAESQERHPIALAPVRESLDRVERTLDALAARWSEPAAPSDGNWLLEPADSGR